jgi:hypothetical protein
MRFYQTKEAIDWPTERYLDTLFFLRQEFGYSFAHSSDGSIVHVDRGQPHGEAMSPYTELLGYGLSILTAASILRLSIDRFFFVRKAGSRPDFTADISALDVLDPTASTAVLTEDGYSIALESKALGQNIGLLTTQGKNTGQPTSVLESMTRKYNNLGHRECFLGCLVTSDAEKPNNRGWTRIRVVDPGTPRKMSPRAQVKVLLRSLMSRFRRIGVWGTLQDSARWLGEVNERLSSAEKRYLAGIPRTDSFLNQEVHGGHTYTGRFFSDVLRDLGSWRSPRLSKKEIENRLQSGDTGAIWYHGVSRQLSLAIRARDIETLLHAGIGPDAAPVVIRASYDDEIAKEAVLSELRKAAPYAK